MDEPKLYLLHITDSELDAMCDALSTLAFEVEAELPHLAKVADGLNERAWALRGIVQPVFGEQLMRYHGLGRAKRRPQG